MKKKSAADLIAEKQVPKIPPPSAAALKGLAELTKYNDAQHNRTMRVGKVKAIEFLRAHGWKGAGRDALDALCAAKLKRTSYNTP